MFQKHNVPADGGDQGFLQQRTVCGFGHGSTTGWVIILPVAASGFGRAVCTRSSNVVARTPRASAAARRVRS